MDDPGFMCRVQRVRDRRGDADRLVHRQLLVAIDALPECLPLHIGHHVEEERVRLA